MAWIGAVLTAMGQGIASATPATLASAASTGAAVYTASQAGKTPKVETPSGAGQAVSVDSTRPGGRKNLRQRRASLATRNTLDTSGSKKNTLLGA